MVHKGPLSCSQDPTTSPYSELYESNPHLLILFLEDHF